MIVRKFLSWAQTASAGERAEAVSALARAYLYADLSEQDAEDAEVALTARLDDSSVLVRRAMAEAFASAADAPHHIVASLAADQSDVSAPVLARSPLLSDAELVDLAAIGDVYAQSAVALRPALSTAVSAALAEIGCREAVIVLAQNCGADLSDVSIRRIIERFGSDGEVREALLARPNVSAAMCYDLAQETARSLARFVGQCGWLTAGRLERLEKEAGESSAILAVARQEPAGLTQFVRHMCGIGALNPGLLLRSLLTGTRDLTQMALVELADMPMVRVGGLMRDAQGSGFAALYCRAGLPRNLLPAFRAALMALRLYPDEAQDGHLSRVLIAHVLSVCGATGDLSPQLLALLRRFEAEAARVAARQIAQDMIREDMNREDKVAGQPQQMALAAVAAALEDGFDLEGEMADAPAGADAVSVADEALPHFAEAA